MLATHRFQPGQNEYGGIRSQLENGPRPLSKGEWAFGSGRSPVHPEGSGRLCAANPGHARQTTAPALPRRCRAPPGLPAAFAENKRFDPIRNG